MKNTPEMIKKYKKLLIGILITAFYIFCLYLITQSGEQRSAIINTAIHSILFFITYFIYKKEPNKKSKFIFLNFVIFFSLSCFILIYYYLQLFIDSVDDYTRFYIYEYYISTYVFLLSFAIIYLVIDVLFHSFSIFKKYVVSLSIVLFFFIWYFHPFIIDPLYLYKTEDIKQWKVLSESLDPSKPILNVEEVAKTVQLQKYKDGVPVAMLYPEENIKRIEELEQYLPGNNYLVLLFKPLYLGIIYMYIVLIGFMMLFFGYQYKKDPPQGAYIDKIIFSLLLFVSTEIIHYWGYINSVEFKVFYDVFVAGQYITVFMLLLMIVFFSLRLRFISSVTGEFYETELATNPQRISRLRDLVDNLILRKFFNILPLKGRLFQNNT